MSSDINLIDDKDMWLNVTLKAGGAYITAMSQDDDDEGVATALIRSEPLTSAQVGEMIEGLGAVKEFLENIERHAS